MSAPDPTNRCQLPDYPRYCVFLKPTITSEKVKVGEYTYYDASQHTSSFERERVLYGFGRDVTVMPGVTIGNGAIIATAAVVTRDVAPYTVVGGNPAQLIKRRYSAAEVELPQQAAWWDWPIEVISAHVATLMAGTPAQIAEIARIAPAILRRGGTHP